MSNMGFLQKYLVMLFIAIGLKNFKFVLTNEFIYFCLELKNEVTPLMYTQASCALIYLSISVVQNNNRKKYTNMRNF